MVSMNQPKSRSQPVKTSNVAFAKCSLCGHPFERAAGGKTFPFCSVRCQQIDLGQWLDEKLGLPTDGHEEQEFTAEDAGFLE